MRGDTLYAAKTGVEIVATVKSKDFTHKGKKYVKKAGRVTLRFFQFKDGDASIRFILQPKEAHKLYRDIMKTIKTKKSRESLVHKYEKDEKTITTRVNVEYWKSKSGKEGFALVLNQRNGEQKIEVNVPLSEDDISYAGDLLRTLAVEQAWSRAELLEGEGPVDDTPTPPEEIPEEGDDVVPDDIEF